MIEVPGKEAALGCVYLTDADTRRRTPEFAGNAALILAAPEMYRMLKCSLRNEGSVALKRGIKALLARIEKQAEALCPRKK
jgi:hypothetical protein